LPFEAARLDLWGGGFVRHYRCYFNQIDGTPVARRSFHSENDSEALDHALGLFVGYEHADKLELWDGTHLTYSRRRAESKTPAALRERSYLALAATRLEADPEIRIALVSRAVALVREAAALESSIDRAANRRGRIFTGGA
jgi:hypothetical protein